jgi:O-antigen ligase
MRPFSRSELHIAGDVLTEGWTSAGAVVLFVAVALIVLGFIPLVPPEDAIAGGGVTARGGIEYVLILSGVLMMAAYAKSRESLAFNIRTPAFLLVSLFTFWAVLSSLWSPNPILTIAKSAELLMITAAAAMFVTIASHSAGGQKRIETILVLSLLVVIVALILGNVFIWGSPLPTTGNDTLPLELLGSEPPIMTDRPRLILAFAHPLLAGDLLALSAICLLAADVNRLLKALILPALLTLLWMADARGPTGGLVIAFVAMIVLRFRRNDVRAIALMLVISVCLAGALVFQDRLPKLMSPLMTDDVYTLNSRTELWAKAFEHIKEQPIAGCGYYTSRYLLMKDFIWGGHAHNSFLEVLLTTGLVGLLLLCAFVVYLFKTVLTTKNSLLLGVTIYTLIQGMLNPLLFVAGLPMFVLTVSVLSAGMLDTERAENEPDFFSKRGAWQ